MMEIKKFPRPLLNSLQINQNQIHDVDNSYFITPNTSFNYTTFGSKNASYKHAQPSSVTLLNKKNDLKQTHI